MLHFLIWILNIITEYYFRHEEKRCEATLRVSYIKVLYTLKIFVPVQNVDNILGENILGGQYSRRQYSRGQYLKHLRIALFFDLKGNSFVLHTKFRDPQFFWYPQIFFSMFSGIFSDFVDTPRFFFEFFNLIFSQFFGTPDFFFDFCFQFQRFFSWPPVFFFVYPDFLCWLEGEGEIREESWVSPSVAHTGHSRSCTV